LFKDGECLECLLALLAFFDRGQTTCAAVHPSVTKPALCTNNELIVIFNTLSTYQRLHLWSLYPFGFACPCVLVSEDLGCVGDSSLHTAIKKPPDHQKGKATSFNCPSQ
jgi:hypothetical protein